MGIPQDKIEMVRAKVFKFPPSLSLLSWEKVSLMFHPNTSQCVRAMRLPEGAEQVHNEDNSQCISGQLCDTEGWTKPRCRVTAASAERQVSLRKTCQLHVHWQHCTWHLMTTERRAQKDLLGVTAIDKRVKDKVLALLTSFKGICLNRCSASLNWMIHLRGWPAAF